MFLILLVSLIVSAPTLLSTVPLAAQWNDLSGNVFSEEVYGPVEMEFVEKYTDKGIVPWEGIEYISYVNRVALCSRVYESHTGVHLGRLVRPQPCKMLVPSLFREVFFKFLKTNPKELELLFCGFEEMTFSDYHEHIESIFIFKGAQERTVFVLKQDANQRVNFAGVVREIDWFEFVDTVPESIDSDTENEEDIKKHVNNWVMTRDDEEALHREHKDELPKRQVHTFPKMSRRPAHKFPALSSINFENDH